ncbi:MgtC/SapB family protein [Gloeothece verrucosa]|uniref:MgtC/SapB transporter n=1 Tax=Gloeothece verrucosa (strain PCC 7822) TaxID=497965 RepID=E0UKQ9_GLOV7|nr:MgtC/SapB family protein [Gloeothece verrucosa]ADN17539.1 MgtC/SapB transporter [Gloeothece verrucosa PCC 7822]
MNDWTQITIKLFTATLLGGLLGLNRELTGKYGGFKTNAIVALASSSFVILTSIFEPSEVPRVITGVIQGVGFIGGGLIFKENRTTRGLTGAAEIWLSSALGLACGVGLWPLAVLSLIFALIVLIGGKFLFNKLKNRENR